MDPNAPLSAHGAGFCGEGARGLPRTQVGETEARGQICTCGSMKSSKSPQTFGSPELGCEDGDRVTLRGTGFGSGSSPWKPEHGSTWAARELTVQGLPSSSPGEGQQGTCV